MRIIDPTVAKIEGAEFYITPFAAMYAATLFTEISTIAIPIAGGVIPLVAEGGGLLDLKVDDVVSGVTEGLKAMSPEKVDALMHKLLLTGNVAVKYRDADGDTVEDKLSEDIINEIFCAKINGLFALMWEVIKVNYGDFFGKLLAQYGKVQTAKKVRIQK